jgi:hypothetical protein
VVLVPMPVLARHIPEVVGVEHIPDVELDMAQARAKHIQQLVGGIDILAEREAGNPVEQDHRGELEQLEPRIRNSHMGSLRPVVVVQLELVVELERCTQLVEAGLGLLDLVTIHQQEI